MGNSWSAVESTAGTVLCGSWASSILFGVTFFLYTRYWLEFKFSDPLWLRVLVCAQMGTDIISQLGQYVMIYELVITNYANPNFLSVQNWTYGCYLVSTQTCGLLVQLYLVLRIFRLGKSYLVSLGLLTCSMVAWASALATTIALFVTYKTRDERKHLSTYVNLWLASSAAVDILLAVVLVLLLRQMRSGMAKTRSFVNKVAIQSVQTGSLTSAAALTVLIIFVIDADSNLHVAIGFCLGRLYSLTLITNLLVRKSEEAEQVRKSSHPAASKTKSFNTARNDRNDGVFVTTVAQIEIDGQHTDEKDGNESIKMVNFSPSHDKEIPAGW